MSLSTDVFHDMARQLPGSPWTLSGSRMAASLNTGMSSRTKPDVNPLRADCRCSAITSLPNQLIHQSQINETSMKLNENTIFIAGGGTGTVPGVAANLHQLGTKRA